MREEMKLRAEKPRTRSNGLPDSARKRKENQFSLPGFPSLGRRGNCLYTKHKRIIATTNKILSLRANKMMMVSYSP